MTNEQFLYWLQGMLEYTHIGSLSEADIRAKLQGIKDHLGLVFEKQTPKREEPLKATPYIPPVEKVKGIEPDEALKKAWADGLRKIKRDPTPSPFPYPQPKYDPLPGSDPNYWLTQPNWRYTDPRQGLGYDMKPGVLYC
jgi:hypothetical protein